MILSIFNCNKVHINSQHFYMLRVAQNWHLLSCDCHTWLRRCRKRAGALLRMEASAATALDIDTAPRQLALKSCNNQQS